MNRNFCVFIVSLPDAETKRENISKSLLEARCSFEFIDAIDGRVNDFTKQRKKIPWSRKFWPKTTSTEIACHLSHLKVYQKFLESSFQFCVVFEDDVFVCKDLNLKINKLIQGDFQKAAGNVFLLQETENIASKWIASSYLIDRDAAEKILSFGNEFDFLADDWGLLEEILNINVQFTKYPVVREYFNFSDLGGARNIKWRKFKKSPIYILFLLFYVLPGKFRLK